MRKVTLLVLVAGVTVLLVGYLGFPGLQRFLAGLRSQEVQLDSDSNGDSSGGDATVESEPRLLRVITVLPQDAIPAILSPTFVTAAEAESQMSPDELVIGLSINGEHRAYSIPMLSRHEIVNDAVGGVPVAVTW